MSSILSDIEAAAPTIAGLCLGPLAATGVSVAEKALGLTPPAGATVDERAKEVATAFATATPAQVLALKQADDDLKKSFLNAGINLAKLGVDDRSSARKMMVATKSYMPAVLTALIVLAVTAMGVCLLLGKVPPHPSGVVDSLLGALGLGLLHAMHQSFTFWFGGNASVSDTNKQLTAALTSAKALNQGG